MIDWLTLVVPYDGPEISGGRLVHLGPGGDILYEQIKFMSVEGSWSSKVAVKSHPDGIWISGNPAKWLQGHNLFGSSDLQAVASAFGCSVFRALGIYDLEAWGRVQSGDYDLKRVDLTESFELKNTEEVRSWLRAAVEIATGKHQKVSDYKGKTLYLGKNSRRISIKAYCKADEIKDHPFSCEFSPEDIEYLTDWATNKLRIEITLRGMALRDLKLEKGKNWTEDVARGLFNLKLKNLKISGAYKLPDEDIMLLPNKYRAVYELWKEGKDVKEMFARATYYRYKKYFFEEHKINLEVPPPSVSKTNVVPLLRVLEAKPVGIPEDAHDRGLYFAATA